MPNVAIEVVAPLFGLMVAGFLAGRFGALSADSSAALSRFVFLFSLPALIFVALARVPVAEFFDWPFIVALSVPMLVVYLFGLIVARLFFPDTLAAHGMHALCAMFSSTAYLGLPMLVMAYGKQALIPGVIGSVVTGAVFLPLSVLLAEIDKGRAKGRTSLKPLFDALRTPMILATVAGLAVSGFGIPLPRPFVTFCDSLGAAFIPCALFAAGLFVAGFSVKGETREIGWVVAVKMVVHPAIAWWFATTFLHLDKTALACAVLLAALPTGAPAFVVAQQYKTYVARASAIIVVSTILSVATLTALLFAFAP